MKTYNNSKNCVYEDDNNNNNNMSHTHVRVEHVWTLEVSMACLADEVQDVTPDTVS